VFTYFCIGLALGAMIVFLPNLAMCRTLFRLMHHDPQKCRYLFEGSLEMCDLEAGHDCPHMTKPRKVRRFF